MPMTKNSFLMISVLTTQKITRSRKTKPSSQEGPVEGLWLGKVEAQRPYKIG